MELWIRSQDKGILKKCDAVILNGLGLRIIIFGEEPEEYCLTDENDVVLARYKTKERALEVINQIHQLLIDLQTLEITKDTRFAKKRNLNCVYEMPEE